MFRPQHHDGESNGRHRTTIERQRFHAPLFLFSQSNISRKEERQLPRKGYLKIPRSHGREDLLVGEILRSMSTTVRLLPRLGMRIPSPQRKRFIRSSDRINRAHLALENTRARSFGFVADFPRSKDVTRGSKDDRQTGSSEICPERKLAVAVFSQATNDLRKFRYARRGSGYSLYADARKWIASNDRLWPYSFLNLCDALYLAADVIRAELLGNTSGRASLKSRTG
jgi:hypothetical protein